jgi:hypothetical protein
MLLSQLLSLRILLTCLNSKPRRITWLISNSNLTKFQKSLKPLMERPQTLRLFKKCPPFLRRIKSLTINLRLTTCILIILKSATRCSNASKRIELQTCYTLSSPRILLTPLNASTVNQMLPGLPEFQKTFRIPHSMRFANL